MYSFLDVDRTVSRSATCSPRTGVSCRVVRRLVKSDGTVIHALVTVVVEFENEKIVRRRDYGDDWMLKLERGGEMTS